MIRQIFKLFIFCAFLLCAFELKAQKDAVNIFEHTRPVPETEIVHQSGKSYRLSDFKGEFVLAAFWSKTCGPCIKELKDLNTFYNAALKEKIRLILISPQKDWKSAVEQKKFLKKYGAPDIEFYTDPKGKLAADFGIFTTPHTVLVDENSEEMGRIRGTAKWSDPRVLEYIKKIKKDKR